jgi:hypothetical protein
LQRKQELAREKEISKTTGDDDLGKPRVGRLDGMKALQLAWQTDGIDSKLDVVDGVKHDSGGVWAWCKRFLRNR